MSAYRVLDRDLKTIAYEGDDLGEATTEFWELATHNSKVCGPSWKADVILHDYAGIDDHVPHVFAATGDDKVLCVMKGATVEAIRPYGPELVLD